MIYRYTNFVPHLAGRYLSSNVNITVFNSDGEAESVPVGSKFEFKVYLAVVIVYVPSTDRYTKFTTRK
jgi:hypothetical protein